jgi:hypothetical protein
VAGSTQPPVTGFTLPPSIAVTNGRRLAKASRTRYGCPRAVIDQGAVARITVPVPGGVHPNRAPVAGGS